MHLSPPIAIVCLVFAAPVVAQNTQAPPVPRLPVEAVPMPPPIVRIPAPAPPPSAATTLPVPASNPAEWIRPEDYPAWAIREDVTGRLRVRIRVNANGGVASCQVTAGSGIAELDRLACERITERASFLPARDANGHAVPGWWNTEVRWEIPEKLPESAPPPGRAVFSFVVERDGTVSDCRVDAVEGLSEPPGPPPCADDDRFEPIFGEDGNPERRRVRVTIQVEHEPLAD